MVSLIYQGGQFGVQSSSLVSWALLWYAAGLVGHSVVEIFSRAFYALHNTKTPVLVGVAAMSLNLFFSIRFSNLVRKNRLDAARRVGAGELAGDLPGDGCALFMIKRSFTGLEANEIWGAAWQAGMGALGMSLASVFSLSNSQDLPVAPQSWAGLSWAAWFICW